MRLKMRSTPLPLNSPYVTRLEKYLADHEELSGNLKLPVASYRSTPPMSVPVNPAANAAALQCWFNVKAEEKAGHGTAVFGWALWDGPYATTCVAQHHAVLLTPAGDYMCVTPPDGDPVLHITFMADSRVPFDYAGLRQPPLLLLNKAGPTAEGIECLWANEKHEPITRQGAWELFPDNFKMVKMGP
jgi:hypothetical protein